MPITDELMNGAGIAHGGAISTLADTCIGFGAWLSLPEEVSVVCCSYLT